LNKIIDFFIDKNQKFKKNITFYAKKKKISNVFFNKYEDKKLPLSIGKVLSPKKKIFFKILAQKELVFMNTYLFLSFFFVLIKPPPVPNFSFSS